MHVSSEARLSIFMLQLKSPASTIRFVFLCEYLNPKSKINEKTKNSHKLFLLDFLPFFLLVDCEQRLIREEQAIRQTAESGSGGRASTHSSGQVIKYFYYTSLLIQGERDIDQCARKLARATWSKTL